MVLSCTGSLSVAQAHRAEVRTMLIAALGCNVAWGIIDGLLYLMGCLNEQARGIRSWRALRKATAPPQAHRIIADALPPMVAATLGPAEYESIRQKLAQMPEPPSRAPIGQGPVVRSLGGMLLGDSHHLPCSDTVHLHGRTSREPCASPTGLPLSCSS